MPRTFLTAILLTAIFTATGHAQSLDRPSVSPELEPLVKELLVLTGAKERVATVLRGVLRLEDLRSPAPIPASEATFDSAMADALNRAAKVQSAQYQRLAELALKNADLEEAAWHVYAPLYGEGWTADELRGMIAFYRTPLGRKMAERDPQFHLWEQILTARFFEARVVQAGRTLDREELLKTNPARATADDIRAFSGVLEQIAYEHDGVFPGVTDPVELQKLAGASDVVFTDTWGTPFRITFSSDRRHYRITSAGADRKFAEDELPWGAEPRVDERPGADIVFEDGIFRSHPRGATDQRR